MPDFRVADTAAEHPKLRAAGLAAAGLWSMAGSYAMKELTDGWVAQHYAFGWPGGKKAAQDLVKAGLWVIEKKGGVAGYRFHDWEDYQRLAAAFEAAREQNRERARRHRRTPSVTRDVTRDASVNNASVTQAPSPSPSPSPLGAGSGEGPSGSERAASGNDPRPAERCPRHIDQPTDGPCRACGEAREAVERWDRKHQLQTRLAIRACTSCDADGWRIDPRNRHRGPLHPGVRCDHAPWTSEQLDAAS